MKKLVLFFTVMIVAVLGACGNEGENQQDSELPAMLEVDLRLPEENLEPGAEVVLEAYVSQGGEAVEDANEVEFEVVREGQEESESYEGVHQGAGVYTAKKQFTEEGIYSVTAHVTARDMHNMPTKDLVIGNPSLEESESEESEEESEQHTEHGTTDETEGHGHASDVVVELQSQDVLSLNEDSEITVLINEKNKLLTSAKVSYEIWQEGEEKHEFIDAVEAGNGVYKASKSFDATGTYFVNVHINTEDLHEHQLFTVNVK